MMFWKRLSRFQHVHVYPCLQEYLFFKFGHHMHVHLSVPCQGLNPQPLHFKSSVHTTRLRHVYWIHRQAIVSLTTAQEKVYLTNQYHSLFNMISIFIQTINHLHRLGQFSSLFLKIRPKYKPVLASNWSHAPISPRFYRLSSAEITGFVAGRPCLL